jgi:hypothetical protein
VVICGLKDTRFVLQAMLMVQKLKTISIGAKTVDA